MITKLTETWQAEQRAFAARDLSGADYVYLGADGIHVNIRLEGREQGRRKAACLAKQDGLRDRASSRHVFVSLG